MRILDLTSLGLATGMGRFSGYLKAIACFDCAGRLTLYGKLKAPFQHIGGFDSRMRVPRNFDSSVYCCFHK